jgi:LuxR family maltose regulon positive regulatory protein
MAGFQKAGNIAFAISGTYGLADIRIAQGRLRDAVHIYERTLALAEAQGKPLPQGTAELHLGLAELHHERGDGDASNAQMQQSEALSEQAALPNWPYRRRIVQARIQAAQGALDRALALLDEAESLFIRGPVPERPIAALKARVWIKQGKLDEVWGWVRAQGLSIHDDLRYLREFEHLTLARLLIAQHEHDRLDDPIHEAIGLLTRLLRAAEVGERGGSGIEILALLALAQAAKGDLPAALGTLERALTLAEPEGYVRLFVDEGALMARLLTEAQAQRIRPAYVAKLRAAFSVVAEQVAPRGPQIVHVATGVEQPLIEPLSEREIEVLALVAQGFSNREIAERLFIALSTVKGHNRIIFEKLQVQRRTEAVARARELGLV